MGAEEIGLEFVGEVVVVGESYLGPFSAVGRLALLMGGVLVHVPVVRCTREVATFHHLASAYLLLAAKRLI